ncbi:response regulator [Paenibacillus soyae]|uniref:Response regulator n=1 Tax=Paenibacillus soyae TaxID=2969249 RepID=A0A9X2SBQ6_9BACL|nr:response regulator [Paenibacillus soyae]MCR2807904.1 response regulator [Paenibacillus soyae]
MLIVDDEDKVREAIAFKTDWAACGFELVGGCANGRDALEAAEKLQPDVVLTDICMPYMDGLELAERLTEQYRELKIVILTGFEQFDYAKQAIKLKVNDYLLKPINLQELTEFLLKLKAELDEEAARLADLTALRAQWQESYPLLRERFLNRLVLHPMTDEAIRRKLDSFRLGLSGPSYAALLLELETEQGDAGGSHPDKDLLRFAAANIAQEIAEQEYGGVAFQTRDDRIAILLGGEGGMLGAHMQKVAGFVSGALAKYLKLSVSIGLGRVYPSLHQLRYSYQEASSALEYRYLTGDGRILSIQDVEFGEPVGEAEYNEFERELSAAVKTGNTARALQAVEDWVARLRASAMRMNGVVGYMHRTLATVIQAGTQSGLDQGDGLGGIFFAKLNALKTIEEARSWLEELCGQVIRDLARRRSDASHTQMMEAIAYIHEHYSRAELTLGEVCQHVYLSLSYFSSLFKQQTGLTFVEYLTKHRLAKARELLLATSLKTYEISERVGYQDPQYFSVIFKRHFGMSPKEFRSAGKGSAPA